MRKGKGSKNNVMNVLAKEVKKKKGKNIHPNALCKHVADVVDDKNGNKNLKSTLETKNLDEYLDIVKLSHKKYEVENEQTVVQNLNTHLNKEITQNQFSNVFLGNLLKNSDIKLYETKPLAIPKRPKWKKGISASEFEKMEREAFLNWRRALAQQEEYNTNYAITPFEKNIEVWRQLWLVVEKSQILIQIVDGRNPLYFRCPDLEKYINEVDKSKDSLLLINKADLMSEEVRKSWADYLDGKGIKYIFFSALKEAEIIEKEDLPKLLEENKDDLESDEESDEGEDTQGGKFKNMFSNLKVEKDEEVIEEETRNEETNPNLIIKNEITEVKIGEEEEKKNDTIEVSKPESENETQSSNKNQPEKTSEETELISENPQTQTSSNSTKVLNREELILLLKSLSKNKILHNNQHSYLIGFIGYPNVGKSSVINVLMKKKKVAVAQMPGKTKHYQTLFLPEDKELCLMDCPGLVFPSFTSSKGDMAVNGIIPIDTLREFHSPIAIIIQKIPRKILELYYRITLPDLYSATQFLQILATKRGFYTGRALPDEARTAKFVLKDYVSGKLLYCNLRPDYNESKHGAIIPYDETLLKDFSEGGINQDEKEKLNLLKEIPADFDDDFEKIGMEVDGDENGKKFTTPIENFDKLYFEQMMNEEEGMSANRDKKITKDMKRALKFALKRGEITEEEYEEAYTIGDYEDLLRRIQKNAQTNKKDMVGVKIIEIK